MEIDIHGEYDVEDEVHDSMITVPDYVYSYYDHTYQIHDDQQSEESEKFHDEEVDDNLNVVSYHVHWMSFLVKKDNAMVEENILHVYHLEFEEALGVKMNVYPSVK